MCHHYRAASDLPEHFVAEFSLRSNQRQLIAELTGNLKNAGAWPLKSVPAVRIDDTGELAAFGAEWGLLPSWWKPSEKTPKRSSFQRKTINARSETAAEKPTFRSAWKHRRCLLPVVEFFEKDHYFGLADGDGFQPITFAGLWETWRGDEGEFETVTLLTTEPNGEIRGVGHHRMPVLLTTPEDRCDWLTNPDADSRLVEPLADGSLTVTPAE